MAIVLWSSLRQLEAVRSAFFVSLTKGGACQSLGKDTKSALLEWANRENIDPQLLLHDSEENFAESVPDINIGAVDRIAMAWTRSIMNDAGDSYGKAIVEGTSTTARINPDNDYGVDRSSAHWDRWENFLTTSAMLRFMSTLEQYEIEALKALLYYRPEGTGDPATVYAKEEVQEDVIHEKPEMRAQVLYFQYPALWTWIRRSAEDNNQRRQIFSRVYDIHFPKPEFGKTHKELREMRNAIAHGRDRVDISLSELSHIHGYVIKTLIEIRDTVSEKYKLIL